MAGALKCLLHLLIRVKTLYRLSCVMLGSGSDILYSTISLLDPGCVTTLSGMGQVWTEIRSPIHALLSNTGPYFDDVKGTFPGATVKVHTGCVQSNFAILTAQKVNLCQAIVLKGLDLLS